MIKIGELKKLVEIAILTGYVKNKVNVVNLFLIADAESGKSEIIKAMNDYPNTFYTNDLSLKPLVDSILPQIENGQKSHILIPDYINIISHKKASESLTPLLNSFMAEGIKDLKYYGMDRTFTKEVKGGMITGVTKAYFDKRIITWRDIGFLSRMIPITFRYSETTQTAIHNFIRQEKWIEPEKINKNFSHYKLNQFEVKIPESIADGVQILTNSLKEQNKHYVLISRGKSWDLKLERYGFRLHHQLRTLLQGLALYNCKKIKFKRINKSFKIYELQFYRNLKMIIINYNATIRCPNCEEKIKDKKIKNTKGYRLK